MSTTCNQTFRRDSISVRRVSLLRSSRRLKIQQYSKQETNLTRSGQFRLFMLIEPFQRFGHNGNICMKCNFSVLLQRTVAQKNARFWRLVLNRFCYLKPCPSSLTFVLSFAARRSSRNNMCGWLTGGRALKA